MQVEAITASDGTAVVEVDGATQKIIGTSLDDARHRRLPVPQPRQLAERCRGC